MKSEELFRFLDWVIDQADRGAQLPDAVLLESLWRFAKAYGYEMSWKIHALQQKAEGQQYPVIAAMAERWVERWIAENPPGER